MEFKEKDEGGGEQLLSGFVKKINLSKSICTADMKLLLQRCVSVCQFKGGKARKHHKSNFGRYASVSGQFF